MISIKNKVIPTLTGLLIVSITPINALETFEISQNRVECPLIDNRPHPPIHSALLYLAESQNYTLLVCSDYHGKPAFYVGSAKNGSGDITLPLQSSRNNQYVAVNGNTRYSLNPQFIVVTRNGRVIIKERIIRWQHIQEDV